MLNRFVSRGAAQCQLVDRGKSHMRDGLNAWSNFAPSAGVLLTKLSADTGEIADQISGRKCASEKEGIDGVVNAGRAAAVAGVAIAIE